MSLMSPPTQPNDSFSSILLKQIRSLKRKRAQLVASLVAAAVVIVLLARPGFGQSAAELISAGDKSWNEKSYELARQSYQKALDTDPALPNRPEIEFRIAEALIHARNWDKAVEAIEGYVKRYRGTVWEARGQFWRGRLYRIIDHSAYRIGKAVFRGSDVPSSRGKDQPEQISLESEDSVLREASVDRARLLCEQFRSQHLDDATRNMLTQTEIDCDFDQAEVDLDENDVFKFDTENVDWRIDLSDRYDRRWPAPKRVMYLYEQIEQLDSLLSGNHHASVLAAIGKATYVVQLRMRRRNSADYRWQWSSNRRTARYRREFVPYEAIDPVALLLAALEKYPADSEADRVSYLIALWTEQKGDLPAAVNLYGRFESRYPHSRWFSDAERQLHGLLSPSLAVSCPGSTLPGDKAAITVFTRNIPLVRLAAYRVHLEKILGQSEHYDSEHHALRPSFSDIVSNFNPESDDAAYRKEKVAEWTIKTGDDGKHNQCSDTAHAPLDTLGAYIVEARAGDSEQLRSTTLVLVTDVAVIQHVDASGIVVCTANARTGQPVSSAAITVWEPIHLYENAQELDARYAFGLSDSEGIYRTSLPDSVNDPTHGDQARHRAEAFAVAGPDRYAIAPISEFTSDDIGRGEHAFRAFTYTDRPLYRPAQEVSYRIIMTRGTPGHYAPARNKQAYISVTGPHGELFDKTIAMNSSGVFNDHFTLPESADLGEYHITIKPPKEIRGEGEIVYGVVTFRIEEYKKPEFSVNVAADNDQVRVGQPLTMKIDARYFFGSPVAGAKVHYRVMRAPIVHPLRFEHRLGWFHYGDEDDNDPSNFYRRMRFNQQIDYAYWGNPGAAFREGDVHTDANGQASISFPTDPPKPPKGYRGNPGAEYDQSFTVTADVVDDSRRQVQGVGTARASLMQFHAAMKLDHQFLMPGDPLKVSIKTIDADDRPISESGEVTFYRQIPAIPQRRERDPETLKWRILQKFIPAREEKATALFVRTDPATGAGFTYWHPDTPADYRLEFKTMDGWGKEITAQSNILVYGPNFDSRLTKDDGRFELIPEFREYRPGQTARLLLVTPKEDSYAYFSDQSVGVIGRVRPIFIPGRSTVVEAKVDDNSIPNVTFTATIVRDGAANEVQAAVAAPAEYKVLALTLTPDREQYKPGDHATFKLHASLADGRPAEGLFSLSVVDQALLAIQPDLTPDIRSYFFGGQLNEYISLAPSSQYDASPFVVQGFSPNFENHPLLFPEDMYWALTYQANRSQPRIPDFIAYDPDTQWNDPERARRAFAKDEFESLEKSAKLPLFRSPSRDRYGEISSALGLGYDSVNGASGGLFAAGFGSGRQGGGGFQFALGGRAYAGADLGDLPADNRPGSAATPGVPPQTPESGPMVEAVVRNRFVDTAAWLPNIATDAHGDAVLSFDFPDNITKWKATVRGSTDAVEVGSADAQVTTRKNLLVRLQAPRFFVDRDRVVLSANVHNYLSAAKQVRVELSTDAAVFDLLPGSAAVRSISVDKDGEERVDWNVQLKQAGVTKIKVTAQTDEESDAAELSFPVLVHGVEKFITDSGVLHDGGESNLSIDLPDARRKGASLLDLQLSPSLGSVMLDALPYLEDYPYGCTEQTLSRFVPTVLVARTLRESGTDLESVGARIRDQETARANVPVERAIADSGYTYPHGVPGALQARELASRLFLNGRSHDAIFDSKALAAMTTAGLERLYTMQRSDGSWGWWQGSALGDPYLTAYALEGLVYAQQSGVTVKPDVIEHATQWLTHEIDSTENLNLLAYYDHVLALRNIMPRNGKGVTLDDFLFDRRDHMNPYSLALLTLALHEHASNDRAQIVVRNLETSAKRDATRGTVHWESADAEYWQWYNDKLETTAAVLRALVAVEPTDQLAPVNGPRAAQTGLAPLAVRWLVDNRRAGHWTSTRQTANVVEALIDYARAQKELTPDYTVTVDLDGQVQKTYHITKENALTFDNRFLVGDEILKSGAQHLNIRMSGEGALYYNSYLRYFDMSEPIKGVSNAIGVDRKYFKVVTTAKPTKSNERQGDAVETTTRTPLADGAQLESGDIVEVELHIKSDNDYDYVVFEDMKPAGCEAVETHSGGAYGDGLCSNFELRDEKVAFFVDRLPQGERRITYQLRAEIPGAFHALPTNAYAMYAPDIRALSDEWRVTIADSGPTTTAKPAAPRPSKNRREKSRRIEAPVASTPPNESPVNAPPDSTRPTDAPVSLTEPTQ